MSPKKLNILHKTEESVSRNIHYKREAKDRHKKLHGETITRKVIRENTTDVTNLQNKLAVSQTSLDHENDKSTKSNVIADVSLEEPVEVSKISAADILKDPAEVVNAEKNESEPANVHSSDRNMLDPPVYKPRTNDVQMEFLTDLINSENLARKKKLPRKEWTVFCFNLNSLGPPTRTDEEWKVVMANLKYRQKKTGSKQQSGEKSVEFQFVEAGSSDFKEEIVVEDVDRQGFIIREIPNSCSAYNRGTEGDNYYGSSHNEDTISTLNDNPEGTRVNQFHFSGVAENYMGHLDSDVNTTTKIADIFAEPITRTRNVLPLTANSDDTHHACETQIELLRDVSTNLRSLNESSGRIEKFLLKTVEQNAIIINLLKAKNNS